MIHQVTKSRTGLVLYKSCTSWTQQATVSHKTHYQPATHLVTLQGIIIKIIIVIIVIIQYSLP